MSVNLDEIWLEQSAKIKPILADGIEAVASHLPLARAMYAGDKILRCIDEGTPHGVHLCGSGILLGEPEADAVVKKMMADGLEGITSHEECGAAKIAAEKAGNTGDIETYTKEWAEKLAERLGLPYAGHTPITAMKRPAGHHIARVAYYDSTGRFDYSAVPELPAGFIISRKYLTPMQAQDELRLALSIATGAHGFGERLTAEEPFLILVIADAESTELTAEAEAVAAEFAPRAIAQTLSIAQTLATA